MIPEDESEILTISSLKPQWSIGTNQPNPLPEPTVYCSFSAEELRASGGAYGLAISAIVPRPIALISSQDEAGVSNCAPYSYFNVVGESRSSTGCRRQLYKYPLRMQERYSE